MPGAGEGARRCTVPKILIDMNKKAKEIAACDLTELLYVIKEALMSQGPSPKYQRAAWLCRTLYLPRYGFLRRDHIKERERRLRSQAAEIKMIHREVARQLTVSFASPSIHPNEVMSPGVSLSPLPGLQKLGARELVCFTGHRGDSGSRSSSSSRRVSLPRASAHRMTQLLGSSVNYGMMGHSTARNKSTALPVPMLDNPFGEEIFPNIQSKPPLVQLEAISSCPMACYLGKETDTHLATTSFQVVVESDKVSPQPPFLLAKQPQFPQLLFIRLVLQTLHQLGGDGDSTTSLGSLFQCLTTLLVKKFFLISNLNLP
ncbi:hypothetical protein QYF61_011397 [Mycteria americana]|uniref:Uncharacterized protein n=1 Tax=Mycteria americana TaxID=33587 RepID=A0AAN7NIS0_MYCAM|nr:hypothetical protein QYF61_011397 [Mycteria americana]